MKTLLSHHAPAFLLAIVAFAQTGCTGYVAAPYSAPYAYTYAPTPVVPLYGWAGAGFYGGTYYGTSAAYCNSSYYRGVSGAAYRTPYSNGGYYNTTAGGHGSWSDGTGSAYGARGGSANWSDGTGSATGYRGSTASWSNGSGSASGYRGGSASWGGGSGSWHGGGGRR
jgi:hypothetical protein